MMNSIEQKRQKCINTGGVLLIEKAITMARNTVFLNEFLINEICRNTSNVHSTNKLSKTKKSIIKSCHIMAADIVSHLLSSFDPSNNSKKQAEKAFN